MKLSRFLCPTLRNVDEERSRSHQLLTRGGYIYQVSSGIYCFLPLGLRVLKKIESLINMILHKEGLSEIIMPLVQPVDIWRKAGRVEHFDSEILRFSDRNKVEFLLAPTSEAIATFIMQNVCKNKNDFPVFFYQNHWKYRGEMRAAGGLMRTREFLMHDGYSATTNFDDAFSVYVTQHNIQCILCKVLGLDAGYAMGDPGSIGGETNHETIVLSQNGTTSFFLRKDIDIKNQLRKKHSLSDLQKMAGISQDIFSDEKYNRKDYIEYKGFEVGHTFCFEDLYSKPMGFLVDGKPVIMGSYGIGISRLMAVAIENSSEDKIVWPYVISPFDYHIIDIRPDQSTRAQEIYMGLMDYDVIIDDRDSRNYSFGRKANDADLMGVPRRIIVGENIEYVDKIENTLLTFFSPIELVEYVKANHKSNKSRVDFIYQEFYSSKERIDIQKENTNF